MQKSPHIEKLLTEAGCPAGTELDAQAGNIKILSLASLMKKDSEFISNAVKETVRGSIGILSCGPAVTDQNQERKAAVQQSLETASTSILNLENFRTQLLGRNQSTVWEAIAKNFREATSAFVVEKSKADDFREYDNVLRKIGDAAQESVKQAQAAANKPRPEPEGQLSFGPKTKFGSEAAFIEDTIRDLSFKNGDLYRRGMLDSSKAGRDLAADGILGGLREALNARRPTADYPKPENGGEFLFVRGVGGPMNKNEVFIDVQSQKTAQPATQADIASLPTYRIKLFMREDKIVIEDVSSTAQP